MAPLFPELPSISKGDAAHGSVGGRPGTGMVMPWLVKTLLILAKSRKGRELLFTAALTAAELARDERARNLYAKARTSVNDPALREKLAQHARRVGQTIRP
jgi:hypothetical protein